MEGVPRGPLECCAFSLSSRPASRAKISWYLFRSSLSEGIMIVWTGLAPWKFEFPCTGSLTSTFQTSNLLTLHAVAFRGARRRAERGESDMRRVLPPRDRRRGWQPRLQIHRRSGNPMGQFLSCRHFFRLANTDPFAARFVATGDTTPDGIRVVRSVLGAISSFPSLLFEK